MNRRRISLILAVAVVLVLAALGWLVPLSRTSQAAPAPSGDAAFKGKVLLVNAGGMMSNILVLEKAQLQKIGDRLCLVGKGAADGPMIGWHKGRTVWVPMEQIVSITEFDDVKEAKKVLKPGGGMPIGVFEATPGDSPTPPTPLPAAPVPPPPPAGKP